MAASALSPKPSDRAAISPLLLNACLALFVVNAALFMFMSVSRLWVVDAQGLGIPTDFINVWSAGWLVLQGQPATAYDWDIQKQAEIAILGQDCVGSFAWHYPPPFLFVAAFLARFPYVVAFIGWTTATLVPYLLVMRAIVGRPFGLLLAVAFPVILANTLVGQNGFLTAALIGGTLYLLPTRPILAGICLGLLSYKPQYGVLFPLALMAGACWTAFTSAAIVTTVIAVISWLAFGSDSWHAFLHWMPAFSQAAFTDGLATWFKLQSMFGLVRYLGGGEPLAWTLQWMMSGTIAVVLVMAWRSRLPYALKAAALATATLLVSPYLFLYDEMVLAIPVALLVRTGLADGFPEYELPALGCVALLLLSFPWVSAPVGLGATLIVAVLIVRRACGAREIRSCGITKGLEPIQRLRRLSAFPWGSNASIN
jgi:arabinofuranan 3-O-arabinosyltransferase